MKIPKLSDQDWPTKQWYQSRKIKVNCNGFSSTPTFQQIFAIALTLLVNVLSALTIWGLENMEIRIYFGTTEGVLLLIVAIFWFVVSSIDPTDKTQINHLDAIYAEKFYQKSSSVTICSTCHTFTSKNSHHCRKCQRCVQLFDHHCKWLNNCIGAKNYLEFIGLILTLSLLFGFIGSSSLFIILKLSQTIQLWKKYVCIINCAFSFLLFIPVFVLFLFHLCLVLRKKTTLQLLLEVRKKQNEQGYGSEDSQIKLGQMITIPVQKIGNSTKIMNSKKLPPILKKKSLQ